MRKVDGEWQLERSDVPITNDIFAQQFVGASPDHISSVFSLLCRGNKTSIAVFWPRSFIRPDPRSREEWDIWIREVAGGGILSKYCRHLSNRSHDSQVESIRNGTRLPTTIDPKAYK
jgi:hypothetical protein